MCNNICSGWCKIWEGQCEYVVEFVVDLDHRHTGAHRGVVVQWGTGADSNNLDFTVECWFLNRKYQEDRQHCLHTWTFHSYPGGGRSKLFLKTQLNILTWTFFLTLHMHIDLCSIYFSVWWSLIRFSWQHVYCTFYFNWKRPTLKHE